MEKLFYNKKSIGLKGDLINVYKICTMVEGADLHLPNNLINGGNKTEDDPRIIPSRKWLRRTGLDELPQLLSILKGDMSLFGPRPTAVQRFDKLTEKQKEKRKKVKPGIFGNYALTGKDRKKKRTLLELDDLYLYLRSKKERENQSLFLFNSWIFVNVILALLRGENK